MATLIQKQPPRSSAPTLHNIHGGARRKQQPNNTMLHTLMTTTSKDPDIRNATTQDLLDTAAEIVATKCQESKLFSKRLDQKYPKFEEKEVVTGNVLGRGGFCVVRSVEKLRCNGVSTRRASLAGAVEQEYKRSSSASLCMPWLCNSGGDAGADDSAYFQKNTSKHSSSGVLFGDDDDEEIKLTRDYVASMSRKRTQKNKSRYVIKTVSTNVDKITYMKGCVDIAMECHFLAHLQHTNIISLVAVSKASPCELGYFIVLERMKETLHQRIKTWMDQDRHNKSIIGMIMGARQRELKLYREQIAAAYDIAEALFYLHSKQIIFRDLKPDNIGFDSYNVLKLFDFGLAKELLPQDCGEDGLYRNVTKCTGAIRYMAPEVGLGRPYNFMADTYSWSMLLWFMLALEPPYGLYTNKMIIDRVFRRGARPTIFKRWKEMIVDIMKASWDEDIAQRPSFLEISLCLKQELIDVEDELSNGGGSGNTSRAGGGSTVHGNSYHGDELVVCGSIHNMTTTNNNTDDRDRSPSPTDSAQRPQQSNRDGRDATHKTV